MGLRSQTTRRVAIDAAGGTAPPDGRVEGPTTTPPNRAWAAPPTAPGPRRRSLNDPCASLDKGADLLQHAVARFGSLGVHAFHLDFELCVGGASVAQHRFRVG